MKYKFLVILSSLFLFFFSNCDFFKAEDSKKLSKLNKELIKLNNTYKNEKVVLSKEIFDNLFKKKKERNYSILAYYDVDCGACFLELNEWKKLIDYFENIDKSLNIKFILSSDDKNKTDIDLEKNDFPKSLVIYDKGDSFLRQYSHSNNKAYNTMLLDKHNKIIFIGSPLKSDNLKKHYAKLISSN